jgi:hypothetical protein
VENIPFTCYLTLWVTAAQFVVGLFHKLIIKRI